MLLRILFLNSAFSTRVLESLAVVKMSGIHLRVLQADVMTIGSTRTPSADNFKFQAHRNVFDGALAVIAWANTLWPLKWFKSKADHRRSQSHGRRINTPNHKKTAAKTPELRLIGLGYPRGVNLGTVLHGRAHGNLLYPSFGDHSWPNRH